MQLKAGLAAGLLAFGLAACGSKEANQMDEWATKLCECQTVECAKPIYDEAVKASKANEGKKVSTSAAEKYKNAGDKLSTCWVKLLEKGPAKKDEKKEDKKEEKKDEKKDEKKEEKKE